MSSKQILCVAEKNSVAKTASAILSRGTSTFMNSKSKYNPNFQFQGTFLGKEVEIIFTSISGHVFDTDFPDQYRSWDRTDPSELFTAQIIDKIPENSKDVIKNLENLSKYSYALLLWLDNDREGEYMSEEVERICKKINSRLEIHRIRFAALSPAEIWNAFQNPTIINRNDALAVKLRMEIDLRTGAAFTRFQTSRYKGILPGDEAISYGPCQFPTLGFVVDAYRNHINHIPEPYWVINVNLNQEKILCSLRWLRKRLFCKIICFSLYSMILENPKIKCISIDESPKHRYKPLPLTTVELQKRCSKYLNINSHESMAIAEGLYSKGFISYPRTETDSFPDNFNYEEIVKTLTNYSEVSQYANSIVNQIVNPRKGNSTDNAHPPIYPLKVPDQLSNKEKEVYTFIARHYLACCSKDALGMETIVKFNINEELFKLKGLRIIEKNWLDIYPYNKWEGNIIPTFQVGEIYQPTSIKMNEEKTTAPPLLSESDLISKMHKEGIGTDATFQDHILKIQKRGYAVEEKKLFKPTALGLALVQGYESMGFDFAKPNLRAELEKELQNICNGISKFEESRKKFINKYEEAFFQTKIKQSLLDKSFQEQKLSLNNNLLPLPTVNQKKKKNYKKK